MCFVCKTGLIHEGDELKEVNGIPVDDKKPEEIIRILVSVCVCVCLKPKTDPKSSCIKPHSPPPAEIDA